jgi:hypothetical protein
MKVNPKQAQHEPRAPWLPLLVSPISAGFIYFTIVFSIAFILGTIRVLVLVPQIGELCAVLTETPMILTVSWLTMRWIVITKQNHQPDITMVVQNRIVMGMAAFFFLMVAEWLLSVAVFNKTSPEFWKDLTSSPAKTIGLMCQVAYGLFPVMEWWMISRTTTKCRKM